MRALPGRDSRSTLPPLRPTLSRESAAEDQRRRILRATGELVAKRGYADVTVARIVKAAHVSFKTFYRHFSGKEECFLALFDTVMADASAQIEAALAALPEAPWPERVIAALRAFFAVILADPLVARAVIVEAPTAGPVIVERYQAAMNGLSPLLREGRRHAEPGVPLPATLEDTLAGGVLWSAYQRLSVGEVDRIEPLLPEAVQFLLRPYLGDAEAARWARDGVERPAASQAAAL
jgi:AcrR family transcriptional regulator